MTKHLPERSEKLYRDVNFFRNANPHDTPHDTLFSINVDQPLMNAHLPPVPRCGSFSTRRLQHRNLQPFRGQRNRTINLDSCFLGDDLQLFTYLFQLRVVCARQAYSRFPNHRPSFLRLLSLTDSLGIYLRQLAADKNLSKQILATNTT